MTFCDLERLKKEICEIFLKKSKVLVIPLLIDLGVY